MPDPSMSAAASAMIAQQTRVEVIANNLANVNTTGFKRSRAHFEDLLYQTVQGPAAVGTFGEASLPAVQVGRGVRLAGVQRVGGQGPLENTGRPLDVAIEGEGLLQVRLPDGRFAFTRDGSLQLASDGTLVTLSGYAVQPDVTFPLDSGAVTISQNGIITVTDSATGEPLEIGRIELARFANPAGLLATGENLFVATPASGAAVNGFPQEDGFGRLVAGSLESSNVEIVQEMVEMIAALRAYEIASRAIQTSEEMSDIANGMLR